MIKQCRIIPKFSVPDILNKKRIDYSCIMNLTLKETRRAISFANVYEILADGTEILLDEFNYHMDFMLENYKPIQASVNNIDEVLKNAKDGDMIILSPGVYDQNFTINKPVVLNGNGETTITSKVTVSTGNVCITGCNFKIDSGLKESEKIIEVTGNGPFSFSNNSIIVDNVKIQKAITVNSTDSVNISGNTFIDLNESIYNWIEVGLNGMIASGSKFNNNTFIGKTRHNQFSLFAFDDNAEIEISGNTFDYSGNAVRISNKTSSKVKILINNNSYNETDMSDNYIYAGFLFFQDYSSGSNVMDFTCMDIEIDNLIGPGGKKMLKNIPGTIDQIYYVYDNQDGIITDKNQPNIVLK